MKCLILTIVFVSFQLSLFAQQSKFSAGYEYLYSRQWDRDVQTYNFSRPFITKKQPLIKNGVNISFTHLFKSTKKLRQGYNISYAWFRSKAVNENSINTFNLNLLCPGYMLHYAMNDSVNSFSTDFTVSAILGALLRSVNKKTFKIDGKMAKALGVGGNINIKEQYTFHLKNKLILSPFVLAGYSPYFYSPNTEALINQTQGLVSTKYWTAIWTAQFGLMYQW